MTTPARESLYLAQHLVEWEGKGYAVYNPHNKPIEELPVIWGFNNGGSPGWFSAVAIADDGHVLGGHCCSSEGYMPADLGVLDGSRPDRHKTFQAHYPDGYRMDFVPSHEIKGHERLKAAFAANDALPAPQEAEQDNAPAAEQVAS